MEMQNQRKDSIFSDLNGLTLASLLFPSVLQYFIPDSQPYSQWRSFTHSLSHKYFSNPELLQDGIQYCHLFKTNIGLKTLHTFTNI